MASRNYTSQFVYSFERQLVRLIGSETQSGSAGAFATLTDNGITYTAVTMGSAGNSITVALVSGGTAGAEVVTVSGTAISVKIQSGTSTRTQVKTALDASAAAAALISTSVTSGATAATLLAATHLATGVDTVFTNSSPRAFSLSQIGTGLYQISIPDKYTALLDMSIMLQRATAVDLVAQIASVDVSSGKKITFRMNAGATPTNLASGDILYISMGLRNSSNSGLT